MRRQLLTGGAVMALGMAGIAGCGSSLPSAATTAAARKTAFCGANIKLDKASANVTSVAGFVTVVKDHKSDITTMGKNLPSGTLGTEAKKLISAAQSTIASGNANALNNVPSSAGGDVDTYCGVDGTGDPLPAYFATGKGGTFCTGFLPIYEAVGNADSNAGVLSALESHKTQISQLATEVSGLPTSIKAKAMAVVTMAQTAMAQNNAAAVKGNGGGPASSVALYCGQNQ
jgi:hypothetical protein